MNYLAFIQNLGIPELLIILVIAILLFGHRLPGLGRAMGRSISEFKKGYKGPKDGENPENSETKDASKDQK